MADGDRMGVDRVDLTPAAPAGRPSSVLYRLQPPNDRLHAAPDVVELLGLGLATSQPDLYLALSRLDLPDHLRVYWGIVDVEHADSDTDHNE